MQTQSRMLPDQVHHRATGTDADAQRAERIVYPENRRYRRIRSVSMLMDQSILLPNGYRIGLDPLLGLVPGVGDVVTALISSYLVYESARLGLPKRVLFRMAANITIEALAGAFPVIGDLFDAIWKSNIRNLRLLEQHYHPAMPERPAHKIALWMLAFVGLLILVTGTLFYLVASLVINLMGALIP